VRERDNLAEQQNIMTLAGFKPVSLDPGYTVLARRPPCFSQENNTVFFFGQQHSLERLWFLVSIMASSFSL